MNDIKKFQCLNCGECCKDFTSETNKDKNGKQFIGPVNFLLTKQYLALYDWEAEPFRNELSKINSERKVVPSIIFFDLKNDVSVIQSYTLDGQNCPFFQEGKCNIYKRRPIICKQFPCIQDLSFLLTGEPMNLNRNRLCGFEKDDTFPHNLKGRALKAKDILKIYKHRYGDSFYYNLANQMFSINILGFIMTLEKKGEIKLARQGYNPEFLSKRIDNCGSVDLSKLYRNKTGSNLEDTFEIEDIKKYIGHKI